MELFIHISFITLLLFVVVQDFKQRAISWILIPFLLLFTVLRGLELTGAEDLLSFSMMNLMFVLFQLLLLSIYISVKNKKFVFIIDSHIGFGDVLFFVVLCASFSTVNFILFYLGSLVFSLLGFIVYKGINKKAEDSVPLAGLFSIAMLLMLVVNMVYPELNFYNDAALDSLIIIK